MKNKNVSITHKKRKYMAVGCSHGYLVDQKAADEALAFKDDYKPDITIHLGDFIDFTAFRGGAANTPDEGANVKDDIEIGFDFLCKLAPTLVLNGNHEYRLWCIAKSNKAREADHAARICADMRDLIRGTLKARYVEEYDIFRGWVELGGTLFGHGYIYNENAARDTAEMYGQDVVFAHWHRLSMQAARTIGAKAANGYCVGTLADIEKMGYAGSRRATSGWRNGFIYGEIWDDNCTKNFYHIEQNEIKTTHRQYDGKWAGIAKSPKR